MDVITYRIPNPSRELFQEVLRTFPTDPLFTELTFVSRYRRESEGTAQLIYDFNRHTKRFLPKKVKVEGCPERRNVPINEVVLNTTYDPALMKMLRTEFFPQMEQQSYVIKQGSFLLHCTMDKSFISGVKFTEQGLEVILRAADLINVVVHERNIKRWFERLSKKYSG